MADLGWEDDDATWKGVELKSRDFLPVFLDGTTFFGLGIDATNALEIVLERKAIIHEDGFVVQGQFVWPQILGPEGGIILITLGASDTPDGAITWEGPYDFVIGTDTFSDYIVEGKYLAIRFTSTGIASWTLQSYSIDYEIIGKQ